MAGVLGGMEVVGDGGGGVSPTDIDTLVKLNAIFVDGTTLDDDSDPRDPNAHTQAADTISDSGSKGRQVLQAVDSSGVRAAIKVSLTYSSAGAPGANNDSVDTAGVGQAFAVGDFWQRSTVPARYYRVDDVTPTAAVWQRVDPAVFATAAQGSAADSAVQPSTAYAIAACSASLVLSRSTTSAINTVMGEVQINKALFPSIDVKLRAQGDISGTAAGVLELYDLTNAAIIVSLALPNGVFNALSGVLTLAGALTQYELRLRRNGPDPADVVTVTWAGLQAA